MTRFMNINTLEKLAIWVVAAFCITAIYGFLSMAFVPSRAQLPIITEHQTTVMFPVFYQIVYAYGDVAITDTHGHGKISFTNLDECLEALKARANPANYTCLKYESAKTVSFPGENL